MHAKLLQSCPILCDLVDCTVAHQAPMSMGFSKQEYWSGLPFPPPGDLPDPGIKPAVPALQADSLLLESPGKSPESHDSAEHFHLFISSFILRAAPGNQHSYLHFTDAETEVPDRLGESCTGLTS